MSEIFETNTPVVVAPSTEPTPVMQAEDPANEVVGFGTFFGTSILFSVPIVGWIASIVMSFAPKRRSLKNYARVMMLWTTLSLIVTVLLFTAATALVNTLVIDPLNQQLGTEFGGVFEVVGMTQDLKQGKYSAAFKYFGSQFPEEMQPLVEELATGEYDELIGMVSRGEYTEAATELEGGAHEKLAQIVGEKQYEKAIEELKEAAEGNKKEWIEKVEQLTNFNPMDLAGQILG